MPSARIGHAHLWSECRPRTPSARIGHAHLRSECRPRTPSVRMTANSPKVCADGRSPGCPKRAPKRPPKQRTSQTRPRGVPDPRKSAHQFGQTATLSPYRDPLTSRLSCASGVSIGDSGGPLPRPPSQASLRPPLSRAPPTPARGPLHMHTGNAATFHMTGVPGQLPQNTVH